jgi:NAD(P)-dependent dehydrogenase (short-subunit alcohol dehydrogenase family)
MTALVTGAAKRLGRAMALRLAERGHDVAVHYAGSAEAAQATVAEIRAMGRTAHAVQADLTVEAEMQALLPAAAEALGRPITVLVNNASIFEYDNIRDRHPRELGQAPGIEPSRALRAEPGLAAQVPEARPDETGEPQAQGLIVNMIDQRVRKLTPEFMSYTIAKMGLWALTRTSAQALAPHVRVNAIGPGPTMQGARQSEEHFARQSAATILQRGADPEGICAALDYMLQARSVTGQLICVDGGQHLAWQTRDVLGVE